MKIKQVLKDNIYMLKLIRRCCPSHIVLTVCLAILRSTSSIINILAIKMIIDSLNYDANFKRCVVFILIPLMIPHQVITAIHTVDAMKLPIT